MPLARQFVGARGFEPPAFWSQTRRANRTAPSPEQYRITKMHTFLLINKFILRNCHSGNSFVSSFFCNKS